ncbi:glutamate receptor ionotropic, kainate glr-3-like [Schistocerca nitens]|uniref:glutamate receptor ionotropic, kainate glr-3-like n=1 Tax=Schistocerca nitens TaxID=7011 RepID=UPI0021180118|nr:glutamate receptor ionotropic, kainate glr-3-like [Schistocerca nitens]
MNSEKLQVGHGSAGILRSTCSICTSLRDVAYINDFKYPTHDVAVKYLQADEGWWLALSENGTWPPVVTDLNSRFLVAEIKYRPRTSAELFESYHPFTQSFPVKRHVGSWTPETSLQMGSNCLSVFYRERNLHGRTIRAVTITPEDLNGTHTLGNFWQLLAEKLNFTTSLTVYSGRTWGRQMNGNWTGLIGVLQRGEADVGLSTALVTLERSQAVDFSLPLLYSSFCVYIREPGSLEMVWSNFVQPLSSSLWLAVALCVLASAVYVWLLGHVAGACLPAAYEQHSLTNAFYLMFGVFCQQGHSLNGLHPACRMVYLFAYLTAVVVYTAYCAANISFVAVDRTQLPFTDLAGLLADGRYRLTTLSGSDVPTLFKVC